MPSEQVTVLVAAVVVALLLGGAVCWREKQEFNRQYERYKAWVESKEKGGTNDA